ncbi:MAG TPA: hypothetical protein VML75_05600 [Kofleriaceae bacterium]|nr:hypothetical protein [Kofleriaceae bacterium]
MILFAYLAVELADSARRQQVTRIIERRGFGTRLVYTARCFGAEALYGLDVELGDLFELELVPRADATLGTLVSGAEPGAVALLRELGAAIPERPIVFNLDPDFAVHTGRFDEVRGLEQAAAALAARVSGGVLTRAIRLVVA